MRAPALVLIVHIGGMNILFESHYSPLTTSLSYCNYVSVFFPRYDLMAHGMLLLLSACNLESITSAANTILTVRNNIAGNRSCNYYRCSALPVLLSKRILISVE